MEQKQNQEPLDVVYDYISTYIHEHGYSPSLRDIAQGCYMNITYAIRYLDILEAQGHLSREPGRARSIRLLTEPRTNVQTKVQTDDPHQ